MTSSYFQHCSWIILCSACVGAAWSLEDDEDVESAISCCTDGVPFGYTAGGLYYSTDQHLQLFHATVQVHS